MSWQIEVHMDSFERSLETEKTAKDVDKGGQRCLKLQS